MFLLLLITFASTCLHHSRNHVQRSFLSSVEKCCKDKEYLSRFAPRQHARRRRHTLDLSLSSFVRIVSAHFACISARVCDTFWVRKLGALRSTPISGIHDKLMLTQHADPSSNTERHPHRLDPCFGKWILQPIKHTTFIYRDRQKGVAVC